MAARNDYVGLDTYAARVVRHHAGVLARKGGLQAADRDDLEQELALDLLRRLPRFDPARATFRTFVARVVAHRAAMLVATRWSAKSAARRSVLSLDDEVADGDGACVTRGQTLDAETFRRRTGADPCDEDRRDLRLDLEALLPRLAPEMRALCEALAAESVTRTSRALAIPRSTLWSRTLGIRARFEAAGIDAYLPPVRRFPERVGMYPKSDVSYSGGL